jgi:hypothetical protein
MLIGVAAVAVAIGIVVAAVMLSGSDQTAPIGAVAAVQDDHLADPGVEAVGGIPARLDLIAATGATTTRVDLLWSTIALSRPADPADPADPAYDFARADLIISGLAERDITPIVSVYSTPAWASGGAVDDFLGGTVNRLAPDPVDFGDFMAAVATRYGGGFVDPVGRTLPEVRYFEVWNEPNLSGFLIPKREGMDARLKLYAAMDRAAHAAIKGANADAQVIAGVAGPRSSTTRTGVSAIEWLEGLRRLDIPLDGYSQHVYPSAAPTVETEVIPSWSSIGRIVDELEAWRPSPPIPLYITEAGYTTADTAFRDTKVTEDQQAEYLTQIFSLPQLRTDRIKAVVWFNLQDNPGWPAGLLREGTLEPKPSYERFLQVVEDQRGARLE